MTVTARPLLVGETNPHSEDPLLALAPLPRGAAGDRLRRILEMTDEEYLEAFDRVNLCSGEWDISTARKKAVEMAQLWPRREVILLGQRVAAVHDLQFRPFVRLGRFLILPHPSGRNRQWNEAGAAQLARSLIRGMMEKD